ncbi:MAG: hypothetical protein JXA44_13915, partial [Methanospirillaceae archaeon]|nr:hypothetical protein [Methanospirillaceae archaeon]
MKLLSVIPIMMVLMALLVVIPSVSAAENEFEYPKLVPNTTPEFGSLEAYNAKDTYGSLEAYNAKDTYGSLEA